MYGIMGEQWKQQYHWWNEGKRNKNVNKNEQNRTECLCVGKVWQFWMWVELVRPGVDVSGRSADWSCGSDKRGLEWISEALSSGNNSVILKFWLDGKTNKNANN